MKVLLIDDNPLFLELSKTFLELCHNITSDTADSAGEALQKLQIDSYDVIVSDYDMPFMNGITFLRTIRTRSINVPFIMFTGMNKEEIIAEAIESGAISVIQKIGDPKAQYSELAKQIWQIVRSSANYR